VKKSEWEHGFARGGCLEKGSWGKESIILNLRVCKETKKCKRSFPSTKKPGGRKIHRQFPGGRGDRKKRGRRTAGGKLFWCPIGKNEGGKIEMDPQEEERDLYKKKGKQYGIVRGKIERSGVIPILFGREGNLCRQRGNDLRRRKRLWRTKGGKIRVRKIRSLVFFLAGGSSRKGERQPWLLWGKRGLLQEWEREHGRIAS